MLAGLGAAARLLPDSIDVGPFAAGLKWEDTLD
jgi:hypothetical protein